MDIESMDMDNVNNSIKKLIDSGKLDEAEVVLHKALKDKPDDPELLKILSELSLRIGSQFWEKGDVEKALEGKDSKGHRFEDAAK